MRGLGSLLLPLALLLDGCNTESRDGRLGIARAAAPGRPAAATPSPRGTEPPAIPADPPADLEVHVRGLESEGRGGPVVLLANADESIVLPIWIGPAEALAIATELSSVSPPRPLTHDLVRSLLEAAHAEIERVTVTEMRDSTFFARIRLKVDGRAVEIDSRPSDAIAVAMRVHAPIFVSPEVLAIAGVRRPSEGPETTSSAIFGLRVQPLSPALARTLGLAAAKGVLVAEVDADGPAAAAGLLPGDAILAVSGSASDDIRRFADLLQASADPLPLTVARGKTRITLRVSRR